MLEAVQNPVKNVRGRQFYMSGRILIHLCISPPHLGSPQQTLNKRCPLNSKFSSAQLPRVKRDLASHCLLQSAMLITIMFLHSLLRTVVYVNLMKFMCSDRNHSICYTTITYEVHALKNENKMKLLRYTFVCFQFTSAYLKLQIYYDRNTRLRHSSCRV